MLCSRPVFILIAWLILISAARSSEVVRFQSKNGDKTVLICEPRYPRDDDRVVVRLLFRGKEIISLPTHESPYRTRAVVVRTVRVHWRKDGNAVVIEVCDATRGTQETTPLYVVWSQNPPTLKDYKPQWEAPAKRGEVSVHFRGWDESGEAILVVF